MFFYEIELYSVPSIQFSVDVSIDNYKINFHKPSNHLELTIILEGNTTRTYADKTSLFCEPGLFASITELSDFSIQAINNERQRHITVGVKAEYSCLQRDTTSFQDAEYLKKRILENKVILIPDMVHLDGIYDEVSVAIRKIILAFSSKNPHRTSYALAQWFHLTALLTDFVLSEIEKTIYEMPPSALHYVEQAKKYIEKHYAEKILVKDIASALHISEGYLYDIFKKTTGISVLHYINQYRVNIVKQYIETYQLPLCEAALQVGIDDPAYMSRLFKKITGTSYREYCVKTEQISKNKH